MSTRVMKLYSNCIIVKGAMNATICDLQRKKYYLIPVEFAAFFRDGVLYYEDLVQQLDEEDTIILEEYRQLLETNELAFICTEEELQHFPGLPVAWDFPAQITHCIIDMNGEADWLDASFMKQLAGIGCNYIEFRIYENISRSYLEHMAQLIAASQVKSADLLLKEEHSDDFHTYLRLFVQKNRKFRNVTVHHALTDGLVQPADEGFGTILTVREKITGNIHCGVIHHVYFSINIETYTESQLHNTCLNRKISIDVNGDIKNCPSMAASFGNIQDTTLSAVAAMPSFREYWHISKDQVQVCRDCEFRHICTDCRAYVEQPDDAYSKPLKCGYDPYTGTWEEWSTHPLKQAGIAHYGLQQLISFPSEHP